MAGVSEQWIAEGLDIDILCEKMIVENVDQHACDTTTVIADANLAAENDGVGVGEAINLAMERDAQAEIRMLDESCAAFEEIAQKITERDEAGIGQDEQMAEIVHLNPM